MAEELAIRSQRLEIRGRKLMQMADGSLKLLKRFFPRNAGDRGGLNGAKPVELSAKRG